MKKRYRISIGIGFIFVIANIHFLWQYYTLVTNANAFIISSDDIDMLVSCGKKCSDVIDSIRYASQMGRLDIVSFVVAVLGIGVSLGAFLFYFSIKDEAEKTLKLAKEVAEQNTNEWLGREVSPRIDAILRQSLTPEMITEYLQTIQRPIHTASDFESDTIGDET